MTRVLRSADRVGALGFRGLTWPDALVRRVALECARTGFWGVEPEAAGFFRGVKFDPAPGGVIGKTASLPRTDIG